MTRKGTFSSLSVFATLLLVATLAIPTTSAFAEDTPKASPEPAQTPAMTEDMTEDDARGATGNASGGATQKVAADSTSTEDAAESPVSAETSGSVGADSAGQGAAGMTIKDGMAQPVFAYSSTKTKGYTNANSQIWRFAVFVETDYDTDRDGKCDLVKAYIQVPRAAVEGDGTYKAPVIFSADPYSAGHIESGSSFKFGNPAIDDNALMGTPAHRTVSGSQATKELALATTFAEPASWTSEFDYFLVRGFAVVQSAGLGTYGSEGIECAGTVMERDAFVAIVEWLAGKDGRHAFADASASKEVKADWCSGKVGMTGLSYPGAMCYEVATSGVEGLQTVVPVAGPSSWYDQRNRQGISTQGNASYNYMTILSDACASRLFPDHSPSTELITLYQRYRRYVNDAQTALQGDYGPFWAARDWYTQGKASNMKASALIVMGLNDKNVSTKHFDLMRDAFLASDCEVKTLLHQNLHVTPNGEEVSYDDNGNIHSTYTDIMVGKHSYLEWLNLWFTRALLNVENEAANLPAFTVQSNVDGSFFETDRWNEDDSVTLRPTEAGETTIRADAPHTEAEDKGSGLLANKPSESGLKAGEGAALWSLAASEQVTIAGRIGVHVRAKVSDVSEGDIMMSAVLQDVASEPFNVFALNDQVTSQKVEQRKDSPHDYNIVRWTPGQASKKIVTDGVVDLRNPEAGYEPATATQREIPIQANTYYDYTIWLNPTYYTVPAGHTLELYVIPTHDYESYSDTETRDYMLGRQGLDASSLMKLRNNYAVTIENGRSYARVPIAEEVGYALAAQGADSWSKDATNTLSFTWKRNINDGETFSHLTGVVVDGEGIDKGSYTAKAGSAVVELLPEYLKSLPAGDHTVYAQFDDGQGATASFAVHDAPAAPATTESKQEVGRTVAKTPNTADSAPTAVPALLLGLAAIAATLVVRRRSN